MYWWTNEDGARSAGKYEVVFDEHDNTPYEVLAVSGWGAITIRCSDDPSDFLGMLHPEGALIVEMRHPEAQSLA